VLEDSAPWAKELLDVRSRVQCEHGKGRGKRGPPCPSCAYSLPAPYRFPRSRQVQYAHRLESPLAFAFKGANVGQKRFYTRVGHGRHHSPHAKIYPVAPQLTAPGRLPVSKRVGTGTACQPRGLQWVMLMNPSFSNAPISNLLVATRSTELRLALNHAVLSFCVGAPPMASLNTLSVMRHRHLCPCLSTMPKAIPSNTAHLAALMLGGGGLAL
jgi:hypothetical protein